MSKPIEPAGTRTGMGTGTRAVSCGLAPVGAFAFALALAAMLTPTLVEAGVSALEAGPPIAPGPKPAQRDAGPRQIRCWQDGRLLFEENGVSLPDNAHYPTVITGADRHGRPLFVAETRNATCLIRPAAGDRGAWPHSLR